jgi:hypothetical protein
MRTHPFPAGARPVVFAPVARKRFFTRTRVINLISVAVLLGVGAASLARSHERGTGSQRVLTAPRQAVLSAPPARPGVRVGLNGR